MSDRRHGRAVFMLLAVAGLPAVAATTGDAGVRAATELRAYVVGGSTPAGLVSYMRRRPFPGDNGPAVANIRPHYTLSVDTTYGDAVCAVKDIDLGINFVMTLPAARTPGAFSPATRSAWNGFVDFARRHEERHRTIYLECADSFAAKALQLAESNCTRLRANIDALFKADNRACERRQRGFDRSGEYRKLLRLSLFGGAGHAKKHKAAPVRHRFAPSSAMGAP